MKINLGKALNKAATFAKDNPELALLAVGIVVPKLAVKAEKVVAAVKVARAAT